MGEGKLPFKCKKENTYDADGVNKKGTNEKLVGLTRGGISIAEPSTSQMTPLRIKNINKIKRTKANENRHLTCLQRRRARPNVPPPLRRKTNKPARMIRSKAMSAITVGMKPSSLGSLLAGSQACSEEIHLKRSYVWGDKSSASKKMKLVIHQCNICHQNTFVWDSRSSAEGTK
jgi:hypothetical protein